MKLKCGLNFGRKMSEKKFLAYQSLDIETNLKERIRIIKTLDGESWDGWDTIHVEKELLEIKIETKNLHTKSCKDKVILKIKNRDNSIFDLEIKVYQITYFLGR